MLFKKLRSRSKASTKPSIERITSNSSSQGHSKRHSEKVPAVMVSSPPNDLVERLALHEGAQKNDDEERDYQLFLEQARKAEEKADKKRLAEIKAARQVNLSPWGGRM
ncbi:hypothetical protein N431DRAFT_431043 [Stipitochalara longipes BDJ]|nr:hypothetical protein N431DRAFT_431043 [Stipitochalara longipes BDJ]